MTSATGTSAIAILPVRVDSRRLPRKAMLAESGQPLFLHTWQQTCLAGAFAEVVVATDSDEVEAAARAAGARVVRTSDRPRTGSERCAEALASLPEADVVVDVQGDWPEVDPRDLDALVAALADPGNPIPIATLAVATRDRQLAQDPDVVKLVRGLSGDALYFSRSPVPFARGPEEVTYLRHIGVYGFRADVLRALPDLPSGGLDEIEGLEQLRWLENGLGIRVLEAHGAPFGIESRDDYDLFLQRLTRRATPSGSDQ